MPVRCADYQRRFTWTLDAEGVPICDVILLGGVPYAAACPLCGCLHELPAKTKDNQVVTPRCLLREFGSKGTSHWTVMYAAWLEMHPDAVQHTEIACRFVSIDDLNERPAVRLVRKPKAKAAPKRATSNRGKAKAA